MTSVASPIEIESALKSSMASDEIFLRLAYWTIFEREIDSGGLELWLNILKSGLSRPEVIRQLYESPEFQNRVITVSGWEQINQKLHRARSELVQTVVPPGKNILDLGGYSSYDPKGALLALGYPHNPQKVTIVDLHPNDMMFPGPLWPQVHDYGSCVIEYSYGSMANLTGFAPGTFDLIWSGESIEHVTPEEADNIIARARDLLVPGGRFALDTPNRLATELMAPTQYTHPEHKIEYYYLALCQAFQKHGFRLVDARGVVDVGTSIRNKTCSTFYNEFMQAAYVNRNPETSYCFYLCFEKPAH